MHTIVRLPNGVFAPYTGIPTNLLFFDRSGPTKEVWYYEQPLPEGRKSYTKTKPLQFEEFADCLAWWKDRAEGERAWKVPAEQIAKNGYNLDIKNPNGKQDLAQLPPEELVESILAKEERIVGIMDEIKWLLAEKMMSGKVTWNTTPGASARFDKILTQRKSEFIQLMIYQIQTLRVQLHAQGIVLRETILGHEYQN